MRHLVTPSCAGLAGVLLAAAGASAAGAPAPAADAAAAPEVIVRFEHGASAGRRAAARQAVGAVSARVRRALASRVRAKLALTIRARDAAGNASRTRTRVRLRAP